MSIPFLTANIVFLQVREKLQALRARRTELASAIAILSGAASALRTGRGGVASATAADDGATLALVTRSLAQARRLYENFDRRWEFARERTLGAALEVSDCVCVCVCVCGYVYVFAISALNFIVKASS